MGLLSLALSSALILSGCQAAPKITRNPSSEVLEAKSILAARYSTPEAVRQAESTYARALENMLPSRRSPGSPILFDPGLSPDFLKNEELSGLDPARHPRRRIPGLQAPGVGLPVVGKMGQGSPNAPSFGYRVPLTLLARETPLAKNGVAFVPADPLRISSVRFGARDLPLARNLYAPLRALQASGPRFGVGLRNLLRTDIFTEPKLVFLQPYDPDKIPVVLVHGLLSTPRMWGDVVRGLWADPLIREHFQFWVFYYPTGQPIPLSALQLRQSLDEARRVHHVHRKMILVGHSMGGLLSRAQINGISPEQADQMLEGVSRLANTAAVRRSLVFAPRSDIARVIFIATPHRGSPKADSWPARLSRGLIRLPRWVEAEISDLIGHSLLPDSISRPPTSIDGLSPRSPFLAALDSSSSNVPSHSIIGDRGRNDGPLGSDGIVPYPSAHLPEARSELIVPSGHGAHVHPGSIKEIRRILSLHITRSEG